MIEHPSSGHAGLRVGVEHEHQPIGRREGQRPEQDRLDDGEDGQVGAEAERKGGERGGGDAGRLSQEAGRIRQFAAQIVEQAEPARLRGSHP